MRTAAALRAALAEAVGAFGPDLAGVAQPVSDEALKQLKFADLLPEDLAAATLAARALDPQGVRAVLATGIL